MVQDTTLKQYFSDLIRDRDKLKESLKEVEVAISLIKRQYGLKEPSQIEEKSTKINTNYQNTLFKEELPVTDLSIESQVIRTFKTIGKLVKMKEFANIFKSMVNTSKTEGGVVKLVRKMKADGQIISVKYNKNDANTFWGLPDWVKGNGDNEKILKEYYPNSTEVTIDSPYVIIRN